MGFSNLTNTIFWTNIIFRYRAKKEITIIEKDSRICGNNK